MLPGERESLIVTLCHTTPAYAEAMVCGAVDAHTVTEVVALVDAVPRGGVLEVDLHEVTLLDSSAMRAIREAYQTACCRDAAIQFARPSRMVVRIAELDSQAAAIFLHDIAGDGAPAWSVPR